MCTLLVSFFVQRTLSELGSQVPQFSYFAYFFHINAYNIPFVNFVNSPQPIGYIAECFRLFHVAVKGSKAFFLLVDFLQCMVGRNWGAAKTKLSQL